MERTPITADRGSASAPGENRWWLLPLAGLLVWQGWMTLGLFDAERSWGALCDDRPILSGRHPLHLYHGWLGARAFLRNGSTSCYDPAFEAGYPKTPVFDGGSRPAEVFLAIVGGSFEPSAYKIGLALCCLFVPLTISCASRGAGLSRAGTFLAALLGILVWWGKPCQTLIRSGGIDLLFGALAALVLSGLLIRFDRKPGARAWLGSLAAGLLGWLFQPLLMALLLPIFVIYYLSVGARHRLLWSVLLFFGCLLAIAVNYFWLRDWVDYWWLRVPLSPSELKLNHRTIGALWHTPVWGDVLDRGLFLTLFALALVGVALLHRRGDRPATRVLGLGAVYLLTLAIGGLMNSQLAKLRVSDLMVPALLFLVPLAAHGLDGARRGLNSICRRPVLASTAVAFAMACAVWLSGGATPLASRVTSVTPLRLGLDSDQLAMIDTLQSRTTATARILWETPATCNRDASWTTLLPRWTDRALMGGLDASCVIEHMTDGLRGETLGGRPLREWTPDELASYFRRYNIGWVVCWSPANAELLLRSAGASSIARLGAGGEGELIALQRTHSFLLKGKARWMGAEMNRICLADVVPEDGEVVLSLHFQEGLTASPSRVIVERERDPQQDIPFIRLKVAAPVAHLTITWQR